NVALYLNFTALADGTYFFNVTSNDTAGNRNLTLLTRTVVVDTTNPLLTYGTTTDANGSYVGRNFIIVNITATEINLNITNVSLYNVSGFLNQTNITFFNSTNPTYFNYSNLIDGIYFFNVTANDTAGNRNNSFVTRTVVVDTTNPNVSYVGRTDANASYVGRNHIIVEVNSTDTNSTDTNFNYTNISLFNASNSVILRTNQTFNMSDFGSNATNVALYANFTGLADGIYFFNVTANDTAGNSNKTLLTRTVVVDTTNPNVSYVGLTDANNSFVPRNFILVEVNSTDTNFNYTNITLFNATSSTIVRSNQTFSVSNSGSNRTNVALYINFTGLTDGVYFFNVTVNDTAGNSNKTLQTRTITVDTVAPTIALSEQVVTSSSINVTITTTDETTSVNGSCLVDRSGASVSGTGGLQQLYEGSLTCSTAYTYTVTCLDRAGNAPSKAITVTTIGCDAGSGGGGGGGGGGGAEKWANTIVVKNEQIEKGYSRELKEKERISINIDNVVHHVGVISIDSAGKKATIEVASTPQKITLGVGETKKVEVTNDSYYDLQVTLKSIINGKVDVLIKSVRELITSVNQPQPTTPSGETQQPTTSEQNDGGEESTTQAGEGKSKGTLAAIIGALVLAVIIVVVLIIIVQHRKSFRY
ncbi:hypothetical protein HYW75_01030, partial [Candidatus Pacearchaeota archaeon]|nr:hypothetical protein [Candidatus Pacearchaeota archaeon]